MADDLDTLLGSAMKTLDDEVPSGYFEALPDRLLAKLDSGGEVAMQQTGTPNRDGNPVTAQAATQAASSLTEASGAPVASGPSAAPREEDSGLHDIRNLAQSTRQRVSKKMTTVPPPMGSEDVLGGASASWKNLALPQPAKMVSLPELESLPSKAEIKAAQKAAKVEAVAPASVAAAPEAVATSTSAPAFSSLQQKPKTAKNRNLAIGGVLLAAAAAVAIFVATNKKAETPTTTVASRGAAPDLGVDKDKLNKLDEATAKLEAEHRAALAAAEAPAPAVADPAPTGGAEPAKIEDKPVVVAAAPAKAASPHSKTAPKTGKGDVQTAALPEAPAAKPEGKKAAGGEQDPSFDALLKEAGVKEKKEVVKLDKKELSGEEFKKGMAAITAKAQACYKGTQGSANVKLTIAPSGQVSKVAISGPFAGTPEADCVSAAVKSASFPAWDGGPQSFGYPILLSE